MKTSDIREESTQAPLQLEDISSSSPDEGASLHYWKKLLQVSQRDPIDGTDLTNRNLLNSLNTSVEADSSSLGKLKSLRESIPEIKQKLGVVQEDGELADSFRTPPGSRMPLRGNPDQTSAGRTTLKRGDDPQTFASKIIDFATAGNGHLDPRMEVTPEIVSEILGQLQQEPTVDDIVDFIRRVKVVSGEKSSAKSTARLTTWLSEKRERNHELELKLKDSQGEQTRLASELSNLQFKTKEMQTALKEMYEIMNHINEKYQIERETKEKLSLETSQRPVNDLNTLKKALFDSEKQLSDAQSILSLKRQKKAELELKLSQLQSSVSSASQTDPYTRIQDLTDEKQALLTQYQENLREMDRIEADLSRKTAFADKEKRLDVDLLQTRRRLSDLQETLSDLAEAAKSALST